VRSSACSSTPPVSPARTIATYRVENTFGCRSSASESSRPASTSWRTAVNVSRRSFDFVWFSRTYRDRRIVIPEVTIVESWRVATARSAGLTRAMMSTLSSLERYFVDVDDDEATFLQLIGDVLLGVRLDLSAGGNAGEVHRLEDIRGHAQCSVWLVRWHQEVPLVDARQG